jgi:hypothetical protein
LDSVSASRLEGLQTQQPALPDGRVTRAAQEFTVSSQKADAQLAGLIADLPPGSELPPDLLAKLLALAGLDPADYSAARTTTMPSGWPGIVVVALGEKYITASAPRAVAVETMSGGVIITGDINFVMERVNALPTIFSAQIDNFRAEYLGSPKHPVPFGGREGSLALLDAWLDGAAEPPYLMLTAPAGRGKSALLVRWTQRLLLRQDLAIVFVPVSIRFGTNLAGVVFPAVTARLAALHGEKLTVDGNTTADVWRGMMADYLARPLPIGRRLLVVLDGLDEAADWKLGPDLFRMSPPKGLRVLVSARVRGDEPSWLASLGWDRLEVGRAMDLACLTREGVADVLVQMGCPLDELGRRVDIVGELYRLSEGDPLLVRLYVDDLWARRGEVTRLKPKDLRTIQPGLKGYFQRWWDDQRLLWGAQTPLREPAVQGLLNLLSCALGPLSREDVLRLAPSELGLTTWTMEEALSPLVRLVIGDGRGQGYIFGHPRLWEYFHERLSRREQQETELEFLAWGEQTLAELNGGQLAPAGASPYLVQFHGAHVERAGLGPQKLLALASDGWRRAWEALEGSYAGFLNDVNRAWEAAVKANDTLIQRGGHAAHLDAEVRCALCHASVLSLAGNIPPAILKAAVEQGELSAIQGLVHARHAPMRAQQAEALAVLATHVGEHHRAQILNQALEVARSIENVRDRTHMLALLAQHLPEPLRTQTLEQLLGEAQAIEYGGIRSDLLAELAPHLSGLLLEQALVAAQSIADSSWRSCALRALAPHLSGSLLEQALEVARNIGDEDIRSLALAGLTPYQPEASCRHLLVQILEDAQNISSEYYRSCALAELAPRLNSPLLERALDASWKIGNDGYRLKALVAITPRLPEPLRTHMLAQTLDEAQNSEFDKDTSSALAVLVSHLSGPLLERALEVAWNISDGRARSLALTAFAPHLPEPLWLFTLENALEAARSAPDAYSRSRAIEPLASHLRGRLLKEALEAAQTVGDEDYRSLTLAALAPHLSGSLLEEALDTARGIRDEALRSRALMSIMPHLPEPSRTHTLEQALEAARAILGDSPKSWGLEALAPRLPEPLRSDTLEQALEAALNIQNENIRADSFTQLAAHLQGPLLQRALREARNIVSEDARSEALAALGARLPEPLRTQTLEQVLNGAWSNEDVDYRSRVLEALAPHLNGPLLEQALELARDTECEATQLHVVEVLAPYLNGPLLEHALEMARNISCEVNTSPAFEDSRWAVLAAIASRLPEPVRTDTLELALEATRNSTYKHIRLRALKTMAPHLAEPLRTYALEEALRMALNIDDVDERSETLSALVHQLSTRSASSVYPLWRHIIPVIASRTREDFLADLRTLLPLILLLGGPQTAAGIFQAIQDVGRWWP